MRGWALYLQRCQLEAVLVLNAEDVTLAWYVPTMLPRPAAVWLFAMSASLIMT